MVHSVVSLLCCPWAAMSPQCPCAVLTPHVVVGVYTRQTHSRTQVLCVLCDDPYTLHFSYKKVEYKKVNKLTLCLGGLVQGERWGVMGRGTVWGLPTYERCECETGRVLLAIWVLLNVA